VLPGGVQAGVPHELGDHDRVGLAAHQTGRERVPQDLGGRVVVERALLGDSGDDAASRAGRGSSRPGRFEPAASSQADEAGVVRRIGGPISAAAIPDRASANAERSRAAR
jgi:hypothetical protein